MLLALTLLLLTEVADMPAFSPDEFARWNESRKRNLYGGPGMSDPATDRPAIKTGAPKDAGNAFGYRLTDEDTKDFLGKPQTIDLTGTSKTGDITSEPGALPAPSTGAGAGGRFGGGVSGVSGAQGVPDIAGYVSKLLSAIGQGGDLGTRRTVGGEGTTQDANTSLSDRLRSGGDLSAYLANFPVAGPGLAGEVSAGLAPPSDVFNPGALGGATGQFLPGTGAVPGSTTAPTGSSSGSLAGMAIGPLLGYLSQLATSDAPPEMRAAVQGLITALSPVAAAATTGAVGGIAAGTGALSGAAGGLAAAGPGLIASAPMTAMIIGTSINNMLSQAALAEKLGARAKKLSGGVGDTFASLSAAPDLLAQLGPNTTPEEAANIYKQVEALQQQFENSGMEDFLQSGYTSVGSQGQGNLFAGFPQGPELFAQLTPFMQAMDVARMRATDIAARAGQPIEGARPIFDYAYNLGSPEFAEAARPSSTTPARGQVSEQLAKLFGTEAGQQASPAGFGTGTYDPVAEANQLAGPDLLRFAGIPQGTQATIADIEKFLGPGGAGYGLVEPGSAGAKYGTSRYGIINREIFNALNAIQPGNYEAGLADVFGRYGGAHPGLAQWGFGMTPADRAAATQRAAEAQQLAQRALGVMGGGGSPAVPGGSFGPTGAMSEFDRRRLGLR